MARTPIGNNPGQYPFTGPNYSGEYQGYIYHPWKDLYYIDPKANQEYAKQQGLVKEPPKPPGLSDAILPTVVGAGVPMVTNEIGQSVIKPAIQQGADYVGGLLGFGDDAAGAAASQVAPQTASTSAGGLLGGAPTAPAAPSVLNAQPVYGVATDAATGGTVMNTGAVAPGASQATETGGLLGSMGPMAQGALGAAGLAAGAYGMYDAFESGDEVGGAISGLGAGLGASALGSALGLAAIPGVGWLAAGGALLGAGLGMFGGPPRTEVEDKRFRKLQEQGVMMHTDQFIPEARSRAEQLEAAKEMGIEPGFVGVDPNVGWVNTKWLESGDEKDLRPEDIWGYAAFYEKYGNDWLGKFSEEERRNIAQQALDSGAVREHHGTIDVDWEKMKSAENTNMEEQDA